MSAGREAVSTKKDWNTPPKYIKLIQEFFVEIDLDPCSNEFSMIPAKVKYQLPINGLTSTWEYKNIFVNPPYGKGEGSSIYDWIKKGYEASLNGSELLYLIPVATNTKHYKEIIFKHATGICFLEDTRLKFWTGGEEYKKGAPMSCAMIYFGSDYEKFNKIFSKVGKTFRVI
jgi:hypothetical protein